MERYNYIVRNTTYNNLLDRLDYMETERIYCHHGIEHLLDVCRIAYIAVLEQQIEIDKDLVYACGLLHDIGRVREYEEAIDHNIAGCEIAGLIMKECGYNNQEISYVCQVIGEHRGFDNNSSILSDLIKEADKRSRVCFRCKAYDTCKWPKEKKNEVVY